jgi:HEAT repeat protein
MISPERCHGNRLAIPQHCTKTRMAKTAVIVVSIAVLGTLSGLAYVGANRDEPVATAIEPSPLPAPAPEVIEQQAAPAQPLPTRPAETKDVARWIADTQSYDAKTRATAIEALASAPKAQAIPALERVLESGEPQVDRQIALRSLHTLALSNGDSDGVIRDVIRHAMYHSEDEGVTQSAQAFLEDIEAEFDDRAQRR